MYRPKYRSDDKTEFDTIRFFSAVVDDCKLHNRRILHFTYTLEGGGAERQLVNLANGMDPNSFTSAICSLDPYGGSKLSENILVFCIPRSHKFDLRLSALKGVLNDWQPDIIHIWSPSPYILSTVIPIAKINKTPLISSYRSIEQLDNPARLVHALGLLFVDKIVSNVFEEIMRPPFKQLFKMKSGEVILNGMDVEDIRTATPLEEHELGLLPDMPKVLFVGRLIPGKNARQAIRAIKDLKTNLSTDTQLVICGDGVERENLQKLALDLDIAERVHFLGFRQDVYRVMKSCDVIVMPSELEGMPNVLLEAMIAKVPVIASDIPGHRRWIRHRKTGFLIDSRQPDSIAKAIVECIGMPEIACEIMVEEAYNTSSKLSLDRMIRNYEDFYRRLSPKYLS